jgi:hypothetical protein
MKVVLVEVPYTCALVVPLGKLEEILALQCVKGDGWGSDKTYSLAEIESISLVDLESLNLDVPKENIVSMQKTLAENNRLARELEKLTKELESFKSKTASTEIVVA